MEIRPNTKLETIIFLSGVLTWFVLFMIGLFNFTLLKCNGNNIGMTEAKIGKSWVIPDSSHVTIYYQYIVDSHEYEDNIKVSLERFNEYAIDTVIINYNKLIPSLNSIEGLPAKEEYYKRGMYVSLFMMCIPIIMWISYKPYRKRKVKKLIEKQKYHLLWRYN